MSLILMALSGFMAWWATGIDDTLALSLLLKGRPRRAQWAIIAGNVFGVALVLLIASLAVIGAITIAPGLLERTVLGIPLQNLLGLIPILIGGRALYHLATGRDDDDDIGVRIPARTLALAALLGLQIYLVNSFDDLGVHLGILGGTIHPPFALAALGPLIAYWVGSLCGEVTSVISAGWLAHHMQTRHSLEWIAAGIVTVVGVLVLFGVFERVAG